jgi:hypothetical protein
MRKEINLPSGHKGSVELTNRYAKLTGAGIPTKVDTSIGVVNMIGSKHVMNGSDKLTGKVNLMKANESQGVDNSLDRDKFIYLKNQEKMTIQSVVANRNGMLETSNGYGVNTNSIAKAIKVIIILKLEVKLGQLMRICPQLRGMMEKSSIKMKEDQVVDVCKIATKVKDFDEVMPVVQVWV